MKHFKMLGLAAAVALALVAVGGIGTASATTLTSAGGAILWTGSEIHASSEGAVKLTTTFKTIECKKSNVAGQTSNTTGSVVEVALQAWTFEECNCEVKVLKNAIGGPAIGTLSIAYSGGSNGEVRSSGLEFTTSCSTIFGAVHCIYLTQSTFLGTLAGGTTARLDFSIGLPRWTTNSLCAEEAQWEGAYKFDSPDTLNVIN